MSRINKIKLALQSILAEFARLSTDRGLLSFDGEELEVGMGVMLVDEEGNETVPEDGEYRTDEGVVYVIADGKVVEIREPETVSEPAEEPAESAEDEPQEMEEPAEETPQEPETDERDERIANLEAEVARLERENGELRERIAELEAKLEEPAAPPAEEQFENVVNTNTGDKKLDNLRRYFKN